MRATVLTCGNQFLTSHPDELPALRTRVAASDKPVGPVQAWCSVSPRCRARPGAQQSPQSRLGGALSDFQDERTLDASQLSPFFKTR